MVRCFVGVILPESLKSHVLTIKNRLQHLSIDCKYIEDHNLHICFSFLGEKTETEISDISKKIDEISGEFVCFKVDIEGIKMIPNEKYIRVLALGVYEKSGLLNALVHEINEKIGGDSKPPHITLCRVKNINDKEIALKKIKEIDTETKDFNIDSLQLIKSELSRNGPVYTVIHEHNFKSPL